MYTDHKVCRPQKVYRRVPATIGIQTTICVQATKGLNKKKLIKVYAGHKRYTDPKRSADNKRGLNKKSTPLTVCRLQYIQTTRGLQDIRLHNINGLQEVLELHELSRSKCMKTTREQ